MSLWIPHDFNRLDAFHRAIALAARISDLCETAPYQERPGRRSQTERAAEGIFANIAEGSASGSDRNYARHVQYAIASAAELEAHLQFALAIRAVAPPLHAELTAEVIEIRRMLIGLKKHLLRKPGDRKPRGLR